VCARRLLRHSPLHVLIMCAGCPACKRGKPQVRYFDVGAFSPCALCSAQAEVHEAERRGKAEVAAARQRAAEARERHSEDLKKAQVSHIIATWYPETVLPRSHLLLHERLCRAAECECCVPRRLAWRI